LFANLLTTNVFIYRFTNSVFKTDANRIAFAAETFSKQASEKLKLQESLQFEKRRLEEFRVAATFSTQSGLSDDTIESDSGEEVTFSRRGRGKLLKIEGEFIHDQSTIKQLFSMFTLASVRSRCHMPRLRRLGARISLHSAWHK
jgi:hypothetical protein